MTTVVSPGPERLGASFMASGRQGRSPLFALFTIAPGPFPASSTSIQEYPFSPTARERTRDHAWDI